MGAIKHGLYEVRKDLRSHTPQEKCTMCNPGNQPGLICDECAEFLENYGNRR